jgi:hypothetical protein
VPFVESFAEETSITQHRHINIHGSGLSRLLVPSNLMGLYSIPAFEPVTRITRELETIQGPTPIFSWSCEVNRLKKSPTHPRLATNIRHLEWLICGDWNFDMIVDLNYGS